ncbi:hypothetical protein VNO77_43308 [Canavalia gladiata]|uniref:Uncharacterized protein n=1 Tax=Canavalia gladiata TaxID=3824 RepID=A0AAN9PPU1_CANGL
MSEKDNENQERSRELQDKEHNLVCNRAISNLNRSMTPLSPLQKDVIDVSSTQGEKLAKEETKKERMEKSLIVQLWSGNDFDWRFKPSKGYSRGILIVWKTNIFAIDETFESSHFLGMKGRWEEE